MNRVTTWVLGSWEGQGIRHLASSILKPLASQETSYGQVWLFICPPMQDMGHNVSGSVSGLA